MTANDAGTPTWLRTHNDRAAFRLLLEHGPLTRARLGELSGLSKPTATQMLTRLERLDLIRAVGEVAGNRGPNAVAYGVRPDRLLGVAVSVLAHAIEAVLVDAVDTEHPVVSIPLPAGARTPEGDVRAAVAAACAAAGTGAGAVGIVVVGVQAAFDDATDTITFTDTLPGWPATGSRARLEGALGFPVLLENDVNLAATAERSRGVAVDAESFAYVWVGDGLGVGIDLGGQILRGAAGGAGEIGYLEAAASGTSLRPGAVDLTDLVGKAAVADLVGIDPAEPLEAVLARLAADDAAQAALADRLVHVVRPLLAVLDPELVVLGGPTGLAGGATLTTLVRERLDPADLRPRLRVDVSGTGTRPVLLGARQLLVEQIRDRLENTINPT